MFLTEFGFSHKVSIGFSHSALRQLVYWCKEFYETINEGDSPLKLIQLSQTRWLSIAGIVTRMLQQWTELKTHFNAVFCV